MNNYSTNKDLAKFIRAMVAKGWTFRRGGRHNRLESPQGFFVATPVSPSDYRALLNLKRDIARMTRSASV